MSEAIGALLMFVLYILFTVIMVIISSYFIGWGATKGYMMARGVKKGN